MPKISSPLDELCKLPADLVASTQRDFLRKVMEAALDGARLGPIIAETTQDAREIMTTFTVINLIKQTNPDCPDEVINAAVNVFRAAAFSDFDCRNPHSQPAVAAIRTLVDQGV